MSADWLVERARTGVGSGGATNLRGHFHLVANLGQVARYQHLQPIGFSDQAAELLLVLRHHVGLDRSGLTQRVPILSSERLLDAVEQFGYGLESDDLLPGFGGDVRPCLS